MPLPRGNLMTPVGITAAGVMQSLLCDDEGRLIISGGVGLYDAYVCLRDKKVQNTAGGTFTQDAWRTRDINEEQADEAGICSIAANVITLEAGAYRCRIACPTNNVLLHQARLYDNTGAAILLLGTSVLTNTRTGTTTSVIAGRFELAADSALEVQHYCTFSVVTTGFGTPCNISAFEIYTVAEFWREA